MLKLDSTFYHRLELHALACFIWLWNASSITQGQENLLKNPGFEEAGSQGLPAGWSLRVDSQHKASLSEKGARAGRRCLAIPAQSSVEHQVGPIPAGAYLARCWVKSEAEQRVTLIISETARPWAAYNLVEAKVPKNEWKPIEVFCSLDREGSFTITVGGTSKEYRAYHGPETEMRSAILVDDCELIRCEPGIPPALTVWDAETEPDSLSQPPVGQAIDATQASFSFAQTPIFQGRHLLGAVRRSDGGLVIYAASDKTLKRRGVICPAPAFKPSKIAWTHSGGRAGVMVASEKGSPFYTAWVSTNGLITIEANKVPEFRIENCSMSYGILPSFVGTDILYTPAKMTQREKFTIPSTQWLVGLVKGFDSMLVAAWDSPTQAVFLGLTGEGDQRVIDSLSLNTENAGFSLSFVEHADEWHREPLKEDYLGEYTAIGWERPFQARWMGQFFVSPGGQRSFHNPYYDYAFPVASAKTRMWGVWFEDWNHYPFYFDGARTVFHFEKSFAPAGDALIYFLEPAAADLYSPCEIVQQALGAEKAATLFDFDGNDLRKLRYSTPPLFMYDRPVCATTASLSKIKREDKTTVGIDLATHLYEFIREIRGRIDQYSAFFAATQDYLKAEEGAHPEVKAYTAELERLVAEAQSKAKKVYDTPLAAVQAKTDGIKKLLEQGKGDGFDCGNLDVRGPAGEQDDLCRRYNRLTLLLTQTAAQNCGDSVEKAVIAKHIWDESRAVLRQPTRWEPRRSLHFFEP